MAATNRVFYRKEANPEQMLGHGKHVVHGFSKSAKVTGEGIIMTVERESLRPCLSNLAARTTCMFNDMFVTDFLAELRILRQSYAQTRFDARTYAGSLSQLKGLRVCSVHRTPPLEFVVSTISKESCDRVEFEYQGRRISVAKYFETVLQKKLK